MKFDVNVSDVGCNCAAGVFLVNLDDDQCKWGNYDELDTRPQCPTVDVMVANKSGFNTEAHVCENGACDP